MKNNHRTAARIGNVIITCQPPAARPRCRIPRMMPRRVTHPAKGE